MREVTMISSDQQALVLRLFNAEGWKPSSIAREAGLHRGTVRRILENRGICCANIRIRKRLVEKFLPFLQQTLRNHPDIPATLLFRMVQKRGYEGKNPGHFRKIISQMRPSPKKEAYMTIETLPGEEAQVDWAHCGKLMIGSTPRVLSAFVMVLSCSRRIYVRFFLSQNSAAFYSGFVHAFSYFGGVPRRVIIDNLKSGVCERVGNVIRFHEDFLKLGAHYNIEIVAARPRTPTDKGKVERTIRYIRSAFPGLLEPHSLDALNEQVLQWCEEEATQRKCPGQRERTVAESFDAEKPLFLKLPQEPFDAHEILTAKINKRPLIRFDGNDYSVPSEIVGETATIHAYENRIHIEKSGKCIAEHTRSWEKGKKIEQPNHIEELRRRKKFGQKGAALASLDAAFPGVKGMLQVAASNGENVGNFVTMLNTLWNTLGTEVVALAISHTLEKNLHSIADVRREIDAIQMERRKPPAIPDPIILPHNIHQRIPEFSSLEQYKLI